MADDPPTPPGNGPPGKGKGKKKNQKLLLGAAGVGALLGLIVLARKKGSGAGDQGTTTTGQAIAPSSFSDGGAGAYNNLQNEIEALAGQIAGVQGQLSPGSTAQQTASQTTTSTSTSTQQPGATFVVPGKFDVPQSLRAVAASLLTPAQRSNPNTVQAELVRLNAVNPGLKNKTTALGGHQLNRPAS